MQVMLLDRNEVSAQRTRATISRLGCQAPLFTDAEFALAAFQRAAHLYDAVIVDTLLGSINGLEFASDIRRMRQEITIVLTVPASVVAYVATLEDRPFSHVTSKERLWAHPEQELGVHMAPRESPARHDGARQRDLRAREAGWFQRIVRRIQCVEPAASHPGMRAGCT